MEGDKKIRTHPSIGLRCVRINVHQIHSTTFSLSGTADDAESLGNRGQPRTITGNYGHPQATTDNYGQPQTTTGNHDTQRNPSSISTAMTTTAPKRNQIGPRPDTRSHSRSPGIQGTPSRRRFVSRCGAERPLPHGGKLSRRVG